MVWFIANYFQSSRDACLVVQILSLSVGLPSREATTSAADDDHFCCLHALLLKVQIFKKHQATLVPFLESSLEHPIFIGIDPKIELGLKSSILWSWRKYSPSYCVFSRGINKLMV